MFDLLYYLGVLLAALFFYLIPLNLWIVARLSGVRVGLLELVLMRIRRIPPGQVVDALINAHNAGITALSAKDLRTHYLAGGDIAVVVKAMISAHHADLGLAFRQAAAIDLAGRDVFEAVQISVTPKVIDTPSIAAVAKDGIQLTAQARVTVRVKIQKLIGSAGEDTVLARVGEGIVTSIGSAKSHKEVLENPDQISQLVLERGLDKGTAFEILSIDIADIDVEENIGAKLQIDQAKADLQIAEARAAERNALAVAKQQEMKALAEQARAEVIKAEKQVPEAMAEALRKGHLGVMDYHRLQNVQADTRMRAGIAAQPTGAISG